MELGSLPLGMNSPFLAITPALLLLRNNIGAGLKLVMELEGVPA
jgi:hypothetical protein